MNEELDQIRHSSAHLLAAAVKQLYPNAKNAIGPSIENGFYQDFDMGDYKLSEEDLLKIEAKMREILKDWGSFEVKEVSVEQAKKDFADNPYKLELIEEFGKQGKTITENNPGNFLDLCKGGHAENPQKQMQYFKLLSIAGAYWRGSEKNKMLTRIYGTVFPSQKELDDYLNMLEESKKRDHRKLGQELELFTMSDEVGAGLILWMPKGTIIKEELEKFGKETEFKQGYQRVSTPHLAKEGLYLTSGHLPYYAEDMYPPMKGEEGNYYLKPMNCPHHHMIYRAKKHSYREFPIRYAEYGTVYRWEDSGTLMGLLRVRGQTQNDAHIYCTEENIVDELLKVMKLHTYYYDLFGIKDYYIELALPDFDKKKDKYFDDPEAWEKSIAILREAAQKADIKVVEQKGGAAFYGPKFDFNIKSAIGREFGAATSQVDFGSGKNFKLTYTDSNGNEKIVPYILHRAPLGSDERFIGFLIEHYGGAFPTWLSPTQAMIIPISEKNNEYGQKVLAELKEFGIRVEIDERSEKMQAKIRDAQLQKVPYMLVVGGREEENQQVAVRTRGGEDLGAISTKEFLSKIQEEIESKA
jgi:threonyl-tRNA synthetase